MARHDDHPRPHLLVVDDDPELPELLARALADDGYAVTVCHDGRDVPHLVDAVQPAALIVDVLMPGTDGGRSSAPCGLRPRGGGSRSC